MLSIVLSKACPIIYQLAIGREFCQFGNKNTTKVLLRRLDAMTRCNSVKENNARKMFHKWHGLSRSCSKKERSPVSPTSPSVLSTSPNSKGRVEQIISDSLSL